MPLRLRRRPPLGGRAAALVAAALVLLAVLVPATAPAADLALRACDPSAARTHDPDGPLGDIYDTDARSRCGRVTVPLDRSGGLSGRVRLNVSVLPPRRGPARETIVALAGGPGQAAAPLLDQFADTLGGALRGRRLVAFDQRGTGDSGPLRCPSLRRRRGSVERAVADCATHLGARRTMYGSAASVDDLEAVRAALGVDRMILYGTSYGTKVALDYAARYPQRVSSLVLDSLVPQSANDPFMRSTFGAVPRVLGALCRGGGCRFTADPGADLAALVARIAQQGSVRGRWVDGRGRARTLAVGREHLLDLLLTGDMNPFVRPALPAAIRSALDGDPDPLARLVAVNRSQDGGDGDDSALFIATFCSDGAVPWPAGTPVAGRAAATDAALAALPAGVLAPFDVATLRASGGLSLCRAWPEAPLAQPSAPPPDVPALLIAGEDDLRTPVEDAAAVAALLPRAQLVTVPQAGHSALGWEDDGCAARALQAFLAGRSVVRCRDGRGGRAVPPRPVAPARAAALRPVLGLPPRVGRTVAAVQATYEDLEWEGLRAVIAFMNSDWDIDDPRTPRAIPWGGLRGGRASFDSAVRARDYEVVPGVRVTGRSRDLDQDGSERVYRLRVSGPAAARGTLRITPRRITGRIGGRRIDVPNRAQPALPRATPAAAAGPSAVAASSTPPVGLGG